MVKTWLQISDFDPYEDPWAYPIWTAINKAVEENRLKKPDSSLGELTMHISIRLNMIPRIVRRINIGCKELFKKIERRNSKYECTYQKEGYAFRINNDLKYNLLIDIDAFLFEIKLCWELMRDCLREIYDLKNIRLNEKEGDKKLIEIIEHANKDTRWYNDLKIYRHFFIHKGAPYIAVDLTNEHKYYDLLIMRRNLKKFNNEQEFIRLSTLNRISHGFVAGKLLIQEHLKNLIEK